MPASTRKPRPAGQRSCRRPAPSDPDLIVPAAEHARYQAAFARLANVFPDAFYISERGRFFPDDSQDKGRLLSAGYHNVMGYWRDDTPLMELILDEKGQKQLDRLWDEFDFIADFTERTWVQYYFNQSGEVQGKGAESGTRGRPMRPSARQPSSSACATSISPRSTPTRKPNPVAMEAVRYHFQWINDTLRANERLRVECRAAPPRRASEVRRARLAPPAHRGRAR